MEKIEIKKAGPADVEALQQIGRQTFSETFSESNTEADMQQYLKEQFDIKKLAAEMDNPHSQFFFAMTAGTIAGYLKINVKSAQTELRESNALEIERIYVIREAHGKKVGQALFDKALEMAEEKKVAFIWLGVWEKNLNAIRFYHKNGLVVFDKHIFQLGNDAQTDLLMKRELT